MYVTLLLNGIQVMTAVIEKPNDPEVLVSSLTRVPAALGKVIG
jgi:hypothetical protein